MKKDYVICVNSDNRWYQPNSEAEKDTDEPAQTNAPELAARYPVFNDARAEVRWLAKRYPNSRFSVGVLEPLPQ